MYKLEFLFIMIIGCFLRIFYIGNIPGNKSMYVDEMLCGYESWSILNYGFDYKGYPFPVYLPSWGTGMNALQCYVQIPFIKVFGLNSFACRLPAAILGCVSLYAFFYICKKIKDENFALFALFLLCVMPWHIMQSRWSIECNFFSGFITIAFAILIKACENHKFLPLAFLFFGLSLYAYALPWTIMPILILSITAYLLNKKSIHFDKWLIISFCILGILALPLMLFIMVNMELIPEIVTPFISIPKLIHFRSDELIFSGKSLLRNTYNTLLCFMQQDDGYKQSCTPVFGLYYKFSNTFILIGIAVSLYDFWKSRKESVNYAFLYIALFFCSVIIGCTIEISFYRMNMIHYPMTFFLALGLWRIIDFVKHESKTVIIFVYSLSCIFFMTYYVTYQDDIIASIYMDGCKDALARIHQLENDEIITDNGKINVLSWISFSSILFYDQYPTDEYIDEVIYEDFEVTGSRELAKSFGQYEFVPALDTNKAPGKNIIYMYCLADTYLTDYFEKNNMKIEYYSNIGIAYAQ
ncbi:MAG: glycosyltransferase family 39 protein [Butyrivibrio sp.]|nr:glycosyltransferase family 39 protein [Butyrivibrio sp.]